MWRSVRLLLITLMIALAAPAPSEARLVARPTIGELILFSDAILSARVTDGTRNMVGDDFCGVQYSGVIEHVFKGRRDFTPDNNIRFGRHFGLEQGATYLLFLRGYSDARDFYDTMNLDIAPDSPEDYDLLNRYIECDGIVPGYEFTDAGREVEGGGIAIRDASADDVPPTVGIVSQESRTTVFDKNDLYLYLDQLGGADPFEQLCTDCPRNAALVPPPLRVRHPDKIRGNVI